GLVALAAITLTLTVVTGLSKALLSFGEERRLRIGTRYLGRAALHSLFGYGIWSFLLSLARLTRLQLVPIVIGTFIGLAPVTLYAIARRLLNYGEQAIWTATGVLTPFAATLDAQGEHLRQQRLFLQGARYCLCVAFFLMGFFLFLGE